MREAPLRTFWTRLVLVCTALAASIQPAWSASFLDSPVKGELPSCCASLEDASCCPDDEGSGPSPSYLPSCCSVGELPTDPRESAPVPRVNPPDATERILRELARTLRIQAAVCTTTQTRSELRDWLARPPPPAEPWASIGAHWVTDREARSALALLSILRL